MAQVWKIAPGEYANHWKMCHERGCILFGWSEIEDYSKFKSEKAIRNALSGGPGGRSGAARSIWRFTNDVKPFDIVVANQGRKNVVGIGIIKSEYLSPYSQKNPSDSKSLPHARLVDWLVEQPIELEPLFFAPPTLHALNEEKVDAIRHAYITKYPSLRKVLSELFASVDFDKPDDSETEDIQKLAKKELENWGAFDANGIKDARIKIQSSIVWRQGQPAFRKRLLAAYNRRCAITGCDVESVLEAAHIVAYKGEATNHPANGLLLRTDFHTLFDLHLITIHEDTLRLLVSSILNGTSYESCRGKKIRLPKNESSQPSRIALQQHRIESGL